MSDNVLFHGISSSDAQAGDHLYRWKHFKIYQGIAIQRDNGDSSTMSILVPNSLNSFHLIPLGDFLGRGNLRRALYNQNASYLHSIKLSGTSFTDEKRPAEEIVRNALLLLERNNLNSQCMERLLAPGPDNFARLCCTMPHEEWRAYLQANERTLSRANSVLETSIPGTPTSDRLSQTEELEEILSCPICLDRPSDVAFGCGHLICSQCAPSLTVCHICRREIRQRTPLYFS